MQTIVHPLSETLLQQVSERIECRTGLNFPAARFVDLQRGLAQAALESGFRDTQAYAEFLLGRDLSNADLEVLAGALTIGETHFFRDVRAVEFLETTLLPGLIAAKRAGDRRLRIWSAGCATGEEPYSMAILLHRLIPDLKDWHISILGTDINPKVLARAVAGIYTDWSFRDTPAWVKPRYFVTLPNGRHEVQAWLKSMVSFAYLNLADDDYPSMLNNTNGLDLIICRNVLLYFAPSRIPQVVQRFHHALVENGHLVMGSVEACHISFPAFTSIPAAGVTLFQKSGTATPQPVDGSNGERVIHGGRPSAAMPVTPIPWSAEPLPLAMAPPAAGPRAQRPPEDVPVAPAKPHDAYAEASVLYTAGRYAEARAMLLAGSDRLRQPDPQSAMLLVQCHANLGELAEALVCCERALASTKTELPLHYLHAGILQEIQRDEEALSALRNVLFLDPHHILAHFNTANLLRRCNRMPAAAKHLANVRQLLAGRDPHEELPESSGLTVGRLNAILAATTELAEERHPS